MQNHTIVLQKSPSGLWGLDTHHHPVPMVAGVGPPVRPTIRLSRRSGRQLGWFVEVSTGQDSDTIGKSAVSYTHLTLPTKRIV